MANETSIRTHSGRMVDLLNPKPEDIDIADIAYSLARIVRFNGHCPGWNVAQHSIAVSDRVSLEYALEGLLHDAAEAYVGDVTRPLKIMLGDSYREIEQRVEQAIADRYGLSYPWHPEIKRIDDYMCRMELECFWSGTPWNRRLTPMSADNAESEFLTVFNRLIKRRLPL